MVSLSTEDQRYYADLKGMHRFIGARQGLSQVLQFMRASQNPMMMRSSSVEATSVAALGEKSERIPRIAICCHRPDKWKLLSCSNRAICDRPRGFCREYIVNRVCKTSKSR